MVWLTNFPSESLITLNKDLNKKPVMAITGFFVYDTTL